MNIKTLALALLSICILSCGKKSKNDKVTPTVPKITLSAPEMSGNKVVIKWSIEGNPVVRNISLIRSTDTPHQQTTQISLDPSATEYTDTLSLNPYVQYSVVVQVTGINGALTSNKENFVRSDVQFINVNPYNAFMDHETHLLYLFGQTGDIALYDTKNKQLVRQLATGANMGYCSLGTYNGKKELYVPRNDGWLFIYDAATLDIIDQQNLGFYGTSVVSNNGKLFINGSSFTSAIAVYDRATKTKILDTSGSFTEMRMKVMPGTNTDIIGATSSNSLARLKFNDSGNPLSFQTAYLSGAYISPYIFELFPDGDKLVTSSYGTIISKDLVYVSSLPRGSLLYNSFDFDNVEKRIYAGTNQRQVTVYSMDNYLLTKTISTTGYPIKVFYDDGTVVVVSYDAPSTYYNSYASVICIEYLPK